MSDEADNATTAALATCLQDPQCAQVATDRMNTREMSSEKTRREQREYPCDRRRVLHKCRTA